MNWELTSGGAPALGVIEIFTGRVPSFVGKDYFCDSGTRLFPDPKQAYTTNPIWDGSGCAPTSTCCNFNSPPWFYKKLLKPTTDDIEVRVCRDQPGGDEDIQISVIEIYIAWTQKVLGQMTLQGTCHLFSLLWAVFSTVFAIIIVLNQFYFVMICR